MLWMTGENEVTTGETKMTTSEHEMTTGKNEVENRHDHWMQVCGDQAHMLCVVRPVI